MNSEPVVVGAMTRGLTVFRWLALAYAALLAWLHRADMTRPAVAVAVFAALGLWGAVATMRRRITWTTVSIDLGLAVAGVLLTNLAYPPDTVASGVMTLPSIWSASGVVAAAIRGGERTGLAAALVVALADVVAVRDVHMGTTHNIVLLLLVGSLIGLSARLARQSQTHLEASVRAEEALAERERLSRVVHDGVLQTLSYINRRGREIGGPGAELAELAREQELSLRALVAGGAHPAPSPGSTIDLTERLRRSQGEAVSVSTPAEAVFMPADRAEELLAAVAGALDNVRAHAGSDAKAWLLLEDLGPDVEITVRDDGIGMPPTRLEEAANAGRLGVSASIRGRLVDLGGQANWTSAPGRGCTVSLRAPKALEPMTRRRGRTT